jgi:hypothetical protein
MLFTRKHDVNIPPLYMNDDVLVDVLKHKHLGIHFCPNGTWKDHINEIYEKACSRLNILRMMKHNLDRNSLEKLYFRFIRPILEYRSVVWDNCTREQSDLIESVQYHYLVCSINPEQLEKSYPYMTWCGIGEG